MNTDLINFDFNLLLSSCGVCMNVIRYACIGNQNLTIHFNLQLTSYAAGTIP